MLWKLALAYFGTDLAFRHNVHKIVLYTRIKKSKLRPFIFNQFLPKCRKAWKFGWVGEVVCTVVGIICPLWLTYVGLTYSPNSCGPWQPKPPWPMAPTVLCCKTGLGLFRNIAIKHNVHNNLRGHSITTWTRWGGGRWSKNVCFCPRSGYKYCPCRGGGQKQKIAKFCPRSYWIPPRPKLNLST